MLIHARCLAFPVLTVPFVIGVCLFGECATWAQSAGNLPPAAEEPRLAEPGNYYADFNEAQIACYEGSMRACDVIWLSDRILLDSWLGQRRRPRGSFNGRAAIDETMCDAAGAIWTPVTWSSIVIGRQGL